MSFRLRLTAWYLALFSALFILFGAFLYGVLSRGLERRIDEALSNEANTAASLFRDELIEMKGDVDKAAAEAVADMNLHGSTVAILEGRRLLASNSPLPQVALDTITAPALTASEPELVLSLPAIGSHGSRAVVRRINPEGPPYLVVTLESLESIAASLAVVRRVLFLGLPFLLAIAGLGGYALATRGLAPLGSMAQQAHRISSNNLHTRLDIGNAAGELQVLAASFNELLARLDQSFESMRRFVADASHELRTPISVIRGEADVALSRDRTTPEYKESLAVVLDESRRLSRLVDDLLNLARADAGYVHLQLRDFYFNDLLAECCRSVQALAAAKNISLHQRCSGDLPFRGDEELLRRLVVNLLDNGIRYTPPGGRVTITLENGGPEVRIRVADTGIGIPSEAAPYIFDRFYRADPARSRAAGGFGLGLAIVKWIAESHHGEVRLSSEPEHGSEFTVTLPCATLE